MSSIQSAARTGACFLSGLVLLGALAGGRQAAAKSAPQSRGRSESDRKPLRPTPGYGRLPLSFEENRGQADPAVRFLTRGAGYGLYLCADAAVLALERSVLRMELVGADPHARATAGDRLEGTVNYLSGQDRGAWHTGVPTSRRVRMHNLYPGIDMVYYGVAAGTERRLEYDFVLRPGASPEALRLRFQGAERAELSPTGDLLLHTADGVLRQHAPVAYQEVDGLRKPVVARYRLSGNQVAFAVDGYDRSRPLIIDPVLQYSTYLGGTRDDAAEAIAVDGAGNAYVTGTTYSANFPVKSPFQTKYRQFRDVFVSKLNSTGSALVYSTYLGGTRDEEGFGIAVDGAGSAYLTGYTYSTDFPTANALQPALANNEGLSDAFVTKLSPNGASLVFSTYLGGADTDLARGIDVDPDGNVYVCGVKDSPIPPPPIPGSAPPAARGTGVHAAGALPEGTGAFVAKINAAGTALAHTFYQSYESEILDLDVDALGAVYLAGITTRPDFPTTPGALQETDPDVVRNEAGTLIRNFADGFAAKLNPSGTAFEYATYLGGAGHDFAVDIAADLQGNAVVGGETNSVDFPKFNADQNTLAGEADGFLLKLNSTGTSLVYGTYFGGTQSDRATAVAVDVDGNAWLAGYTVSFNIPLLDPVQNQNNGAGTGELGDAYLARFNANGDLTFSTFLGGRRDELASDVAVGPAGSIFLAGATTSRDYPTKSPFQRANRGGYDAFVTRIGEAPVSPPRLRVSPHAVRFGVWRVGRFVGQTVHLRNTGTTPVSGSVNPLSEPFSVQSGGGDFTLAPGEKLEIPIQFHPTARGTFQDTLQINVNGASSPLTIPISGAGK